MLPIFSNVKYDRDTALALTRWILCPDFYLAVRLHLRLTPEPKPKRLVPGLLPRHLPAKVKFTSVDKHREKQSKVALKV